METAPDHWEKYLLGKKVQQLNTIFVLISLIIFQCFRCNNVLYVRGVDEDNEDGEMRDE